MKSYNLKMDLQLFADPSASLQNTTGTMTNEMKTFYEKRLIDQAEPRLVHKFNEHKTVESVVNRIKAGETVALISDAGTPGISDPGFLVVRECVRNGIEVQCLPGATAFVPALVASGLPNEKFCFEGFLPQKKGRQTRLKTLAEEHRTMVFYESPHRLLKTLTQFAEYFGAERQATVSREISKLHEETVRGSLAELIEHFTATEPRGEIVIVLAGIDD